MLTLYSFGPGANSLKPLLAIYEKELDFTSKFLDPKKFEQHQDWYKKINLNGQVPTLVHDDKLITESTVICEYLEDSFPDSPSLRPKDPHAIATMRVWTKWVDEYFCWCVSNIGWSWMVPKMTEGMSDEEFEKYISHVPLKEQRDKWRRGRNGYPEEMIKEEMRKIHYSIDRLESRLSESEWLAGDMYTLADICNFAIANGMEFGFPEIINTEKTPYIINWLVQINDRPACKLMFKKQESEFKR